MLFECHVTVHTLHAQTAERIAAVWRWKTSQIARDPVLGDDTYFYLTKYADNWGKMWNDMQIVIEKLRVAGIPVIREKIEGILHDRRYS